MDAAGVRDGYPSDADTVVLNIVPRQVQQPGDNSEVVTLDPVVIKTTKYPVSFEDACNTARHINAYCQELRWEPLASAKLDKIDIVGSQEAGKFRVMHSFELVHGPNLVELRGEPLRAAVGELIWSISRMRSYDGSSNPNVLKCGVDATARNFIVAANKPPINPAAVVRDRTGTPIKRIGPPVLIDHWPAYKRYDDGLFHVGRNIDEAVFCERAYGTKTGAIATLLFTGLYLTEYRQGRAHFDEAAFYQEWRGLVPASMHNQVREDLEWVTNWFMRSLGRAGVHQTA